MTASDLVRATGGRRFTMALLVVACAIGARAAGWIDGAQLVQLLRDALGIYGAANVGGRVADGVKAAIANRTTGGTP